MSAETRIKVLLVEDDAIFRRRFHRELSRSFEVSQATTVEEGISYLHKDSFQFVLSDLHLTKNGDPRDEGLKLIRVAKAQDPDCYVSAMSSDVDLEAEALQSGADQFVAKPFAIDNVISSWSERFT